MATVAATEAAAAPAVALALRRGEAAERMVKEAEAATEAAAAMAATDAAAAMVATEAAAEAAAVTAAAAMSWRRWRQKRRR